MAAFGSDRSSDITTRAGSAEELAAEQVHVSAVYAKLDAERAATAARLAKAMRETGGPPQAWTERDVSVTMYRDRLSQLDGVEAGLCFGRLDNTDGEMVHIGRIGLFDEDNDYEPLLIDWRAPAARPFYLATAASPMGVRRRRHLRTRLRQVVGVDDEVLDLDAEDSGADLGLAGEATLLAALNRQRGDVMRDIVSTIQAEQDEIIRSGLGGVLVVQGGPGTGKTAVALHRAAYLLYEHRAALASRGVLVVGPNSTFLSYIGQVLPSLGETGVLLATVGELFPGVRVRGTDTRHAAEVKGRAVMAEVLKAAVAQRQLVPDLPVEVGIEQDSVTLDPTICAAARAKARRSGRPHNVARRVFINAMLDTLAVRAADKLAADVLDHVPEVPYADGEDPDAEVLDAGDVAAIRADLADDPALRRAIDSLWPELTPQQVLGDLLTDPDSLDAAAREHLTVADREAIRRRRARIWTPSDAPLLDELAEILGEDDTADQERRTREKREQLAYAQGVLHVLDQDDELADEERLRVADVLDAELLAEREHHRSQLTAVERASGDRTWTFGHVIVDEAQELTAMDWRMIMRRCPSRSMTLVGDVAQTSAAGGASSWADVLEPYVADRWRMTELTINYRTPAEIMDVASKVLTAVDPSARPPRSVRESGVAPWEVSIPASAVVDRIALLVAQEVSEVDGGTVAVLSPTELVQDVSAVAERDGVSVLTVDRAKGLEFDAVIVIGPDEIIAASPRGHSDLYVALTRATQRLGIVRIDG